MAFACGWARQETERLQPVPVWPSCADDRHRRRTPQQEVNDDDPTAAPRTSDPRAQNQFFRVEYTTCPGDGIAKWVFHWNSTWKTCVTINDDHGGPSAGSESAFQHSQTQTLTILYSSIRTKDTSGNWIDFGVQNPCDDSPYFVDIHGARSWTIDQ